MDLRHELVRAMDGCDMPPPSCTPAQRPREVGTELTNQPLNSGGSELELRTPVQQPQGAVNTPRSRRPLSAASQQRRTERQAERRAEERTAELPMKEVKQIEALHDCSGASMHELASLIQHMRDGPEKEQLRDLIEADIERYVHVPLEAKARCVRDYVQREAAAQDQAHAQDAQDGGARRQGCQGRGRARDGRLRSLRPAAGGARCAGHFPRAALPARVRRVYLLFSCCMVLCAKERKMDPSPGPGP